MTQPQFKAREYKDRLLQRAYDALVRAYMDEHDVDDRVRERGELFMEDGSRRSGAGHRNAFWRGWDSVGKPRRHPRPGVCCCVSCKPYIPNTPSHAAYMAGRDLRRWADRVERAIERVNRRA